MLYKFLKYFHLLCTVFSQYIYIAGHNIFVCTELKIFPDLCQKLGVTPI